jgi:hypothetical protein
MIIIKPLLQLHKTILGIFFEKKKDLPLFKLKT